MRRAKPPSPAVARAPQARGAARALALDAWLVLPGVDQVAAAFKWMIDPAGKTLLVCRGTTERHADALARWRRESPSLEREFERWIRFIHLGPADFRCGRGEPALCVRAYPSALWERANLEPLARSLGISSRLVHAVTNASLGEVTGDFHRRW